MDAKTWVLGAFRPAQSPPVQGKQSPLAMPTVQGLGFRLLVLGFRVWGLGFCFRLSGLGFRFLFEAFGFRSIGFRTYRRTSTRFPGSTRLPFLVWDFLCETE